MKNFSVNFVFWGSSALLRRRLAGIGLCVISSLAWAQTDHDGLALALFGATHVNPLAKSRIEYVESLGHRVDEARTAQLPALTLIGQSNVANYNHGLFRFQQPLWAFGRIDGAIDLAKKQVISGKAALLLTRRQLMEDTAATYVSLFGGRQRLAIATQNVTEHQRLLSMISRRMTGGVASEADVLLARSRLAQAKAVQEQIAGQVAKAKNDLDALTRSDIAGLQPIAPELSRLTPGADFQALVRSNEAGVLQKMADLAVIEGNAQQRRMELMPTIAFRHERDITPSLPLGSTLSTVRSGIYMESSLEGIGLTGVARLRGEEAKIRSAQEDLEAAKNDASRKVTGHLVNLDNLRSVKTSQQETILIAESTLASFLRQYDAGRKNWIDVLNTQKELIDNCLALEQTRISELELTLRLAALLGALDEVAQIQP